MKQRIAQALTFLFLIAMNIVIAQLFCMLARVAHIYLDVSIIFVGVCVLYITLEAHFNGRTQ